jgi:uncharacterized cupredoxin-like copper-binding protein
MTMSRALMAVALAFLASGGAAGAADAPFGVAVEPAKAARKIRVEMSDAMRFRPGEVTVKQGEPVQFVVKNGGRVLHEMVLGTQEGLKAHAEMMRKHPHMEHADDNMTHVRPGRTGRIGWKFTRAGTFYYACLIPGHYEAGMVGKVNVVP